jgi:hypothetical protein
LNTSELSSELLRRSGGLTGTIKSNKKAFPFTIEPAKKKSTKSDANKSSAKASLAKSKTSEPNNNTSSDEIVILEEGSKSFYWFQKGAQFLMVSREGKGKKVAHLITTNPGLGPGKCVFEREHVSFARAHYSYELEDVTNVLKFDFGPGSFWSFIRAELTARGSENVESRKFMPSYIEVLAGNRDYDNYRVVNGNYNAITQSQPIYTNVSNGGLGVFCGRNKRTYSISLDDNLIDTLQLRFPEMKLTR